VPEEWYVLLRRRFRKLRKPDTTNVSQAKWSINYQVELKEAETQSSNSSGLAARAIGKQKVEIPMNMGRIRD